MKSHYRLGQDVHTLRKFVCCSNSVYQSEIYKYINGGGGGSNEFTRLIFIAGSFVDK